MTIPNLPLLSHRTWQISLRQLERDYIYLLITYEEVNEQMQKLFPGPYRVVEKYLPNIMAIKFVLEFDDPKEQTLWLLRWS